MSFNLNDDVKSKRVPGLKLRITLETGKPNDFGIYDQNVGNSTSAYTDQGNLGYRDWKGKWKEIISWDRDTYAPPPDILNCLHATEVMEDGSLGPRHGWLFINTVEKRSQPDECSVGVSEEDKARIKSDVIQRKREIQQLQNDAKNWVEIEEQRITTRYTNEIENLKQRVAALERERTKVTDAMWEESGRRRNIVDEKKEECNEIMHRYDLIHFDV